ncbi:MAG: 23S rRNA (uracil(1939)-C(5))-methyltransferase RlmD [Candidatus Eremiobacteraeota bacterium]|nr:23S rRNA (uracil(1939)-C(5))-methyltransferase RlmD [Candidatus Eremiobacteraeota bacterium]MBC5802055.1 23S rRNA (uracil(1939)-C(5))-methyltransferase RlmD [Candidatus Eremiobacteraeota bacterium]
MTKSLIRSAAGVRDPRSPLLAIGDIVEIVCTDLIAKTGQAVGRSGGMVVYVLGPVPGERARVRIESVKAKYAVAELVEIVERSPDRAEPFCGVFGTCGGCQVQHLAYPAQLAWKRGVIENALRRLGGIADAHISVPIGMSHPRAYRNKMALVVERGGLQRGFGFYAARTHDVVPVDTCPIVMPQLDRTLAGLWEAVHDPATSAAFDGARHVVARTGRASGETILSITTQRRSTTLPPLAAAVARKLPATVGIANGFEPPSENAVLGRKHALAYGKPDMEEKIGDVIFRVSAASFFQVNSEMVAAIFAFMEPAVRTLPRIVDLYCGAGTFALFFATRGARVAGIEENPHAVREAKRNAALNGVESRTSFLNGRVEVVLRSKAGTTALAESDVVFLDPPRKGSDDATLAALVRARVPHAWYLSCNPATLARDLVPLLRGGYRLACVQPFDMFPQTGHIEALAILHRQDVPALDFPVAQERCA